MTRLFHFYPEWIKSVNGDSSFYFILGHRSFYQSLLDHQCLFFESIGVIQIESASWSPMSAIGWCHDLSKASVRCSVKNRIDINRAHLTFSSPLDGSLTGWLRIDSLQIDHTCHLPIEMSCMFWLQEVNAILVHSMEPNRALVWCSVLTVVKCELEYPWLCQLFGTCAWSIADA